VDEVTMLRLAHEKGYAIGKLGPTLMLDHTERTGGETVIIDDFTGSARGIPLAAEIADRPD
jgi:hypothetical protein